MIIYAKRMNVAEIGLSMGNKRANVFLLNTVEQKDLGFKLVQEPIK